jgi:CheY-like chemotaxis protein
MSAKLSSILLADDLESDVLLLMRAFKKAGIGNPLQVVRNGEQVVAYLRGEAPYSNRENYPLPSLLLLDLTMPGLDGFGVLKWVRGQPGLRALRIVVLTDSTDMKDVNQAYQLGANTFLVKPNDFDDLVAMMQALQGYWLGISQEPQISFRGSLDPVCNN